MDEWLGGDWWREVFSSEEVNALPKSDRAHQAAVRVASEYRRRIARALVLDARGAEFCKDPGAFLTEKGFEAVEAAVGQVVDDLVVDLNAELAERQESGNPFDHKRELKSPTAVRALRQAVLPSYQKAVQRNRASSFTEEWSALPSLA